MIYSLFVTPKTSVLASIYANCSLRQEPTKPNIDALYESMYVHMYVEAVVKMSPLNQTF
jgi:hypothetical protein